MFCEHHFHFLSQETETLSCGITKPVHKIGKNFLERFLLGDLGPVWSEKCCKCGKVSEMVNAAGSGV